MMKKQKTKLIRLLTYSLPFIVAILILSFIGTQKAIALKPNNTEVSLNLPDSTLSQNDVLSEVENMPEFVGGQQAMMKYLSDNIKYPQKAKDENVSGVVYVSFIVEKDGSISNVKVTRKVHNELDAEAARVIKNMPKWKAGENGGQKVRVSCVIPVRFALNSNIDK